MAREPLSAALAPMSDAKLSVGELLVSVDRLAREGHADKAADLYRLWLAANPDDPLAYAMYFNYGSFLSSLDKLPEAKAALEEAIRRNASYLAAYVNLAGVLERLGLRFEAVAKWIEILDMFPQISGENLAYMVMTLGQIGRILEAARFQSKAEEAYRRGVELEPDNQQLVQHYLSILQQQCKWPLIRPWGELRKVTRKHLLTHISPLTLSIYTDDPLFHLASAYRYNKIKAGDPRLSFIDRHAQPVETPAGAPLKIGYLSSDLRRHAVGYLMVEVLELHDAKRVELFIYHNGPSSEDELGDRIRAAVPHWTDITRLSDEQAGQRIVDDGIQILVDLNGHTSGGRPSLLAMRPAPIIVNWLGYPGSLGSAFHHYIIADDFIIPPESDIYYSEKVVRLPCYQPNDRRRVVSPRQFTRSDFGLPEQAMVYCTFNGQHKITPYTWRRWMSILQQVEGSVLWMLDYVAEITERLKLLAQEHGVAPERLVFAKPLSNTEHLARYPLADLFLDTSPYGAHTTASDAMWMGVPIITLPGRSFASRVCGSIIQAAGLADLICATPEDYVALAVELGRDRARLLEYRRRILSGRDSCVLFDTPLLTGRLEEIFAGMWRDFRAGELPRPDLSNLDLYQDIAMELDNDSVEMLTVADYDDRYRRKLEERSRYCFLARDSRLWGG